MNAPHDLQTLRRPLPTEMSEALRARFGDRFSVANAVRDHHGNDESPYPSMLPDGVVFAQSTEDVVAVVNLCNQHGVPLIAYGAGSSLEGHILAIEGGISLDMTQMNKIVVLHAEDQTVTVQAGLTRKQLNEQIRDSGLFFPIDPGADASLGGMSATRASGTNAVRYGTMRENVVSLTVVTAQGKVIRTSRRARKSSAGYDLTRLFVGSEGTLGIITKVLLKLVPKPAAKKTMLATYARMDSASDTVSAIIAAKIIPCTLEFLDKITIKCVEDFAKIGLPLDAEAILLMETDGHPAAVEDQAAQMVEIAKRCGATSVQIAQTAEESVRLASARRSAFSALARVSPTTILEDATVPRSELSKMIRFIQDVGARHNLKIGTFGHMGDGNLHPTFLTDEKNAAEMTRVELAMQEIFDFAISLGGTITGEHGVGLAKKPFLRRALGNASLDLMKLLKKSLDPLGILHSGKIFD